MERNKELNDFKKRVREAVAVYMSTEGCSCCQSDEHPKSKDVLGKLIGMKKFPDGSGRDYPKYLPKDK